MRSGRHECGVSSTHRNGKAYHSDPLKAPSLQRRKALIAAPNGPSTVLEPVATACSACLRTSAASPAGTSSAHRLLHRRLTAPAAYEGKVHTPEPPAPGVYLAPSTCATI